MDASKASARTDRVLQHLSRHEFGRPIPENCLRGHEPCIHRLQREFRQDLLLRGDGGRPTWPGEQPLLRIQGCDSVCSVQQVAFLWAIGSMVIWRQFVINRSVWTTTASLQGIQLPDTDVTAQVP